MTSEEIRNRYNSLQNQKTNSSVNTQPTNKILDRYSQLATGKTIVLNNNKELSQQLPKATLSMPGISNTKPTIQDMASNLNVQHKDGLLKSTGKILNHGVSNALDATVDTAEFAKNAFKYQMREDERKGVEAIQHLQSEIDKLQAQYDAQVQKSKKNAQPKYEPTLNLTEEQKQNKEALEYGNIYTLSQIRKKQEMIDTIKKKYGIEDAQEKLDEINKFAFTPNALEQATENYVQHTAEELSKSGKVTQYIGNAVGSVGRMGPSIASNAVLPGTGLVPMFANASQSSFEEALQNGATYEQATQNGILSGALEVGTEMASGGLSNTLSGIPAVANINKYTKGINNRFVRGLINLGGEITGEGLEEVASTIIQPYIDRLTYNPDATNATGAEIWASFRDSILPTIIMQGGSVAVQSQQINKYYNQQINEVQKANLDNAQKTQLINELNSQKKAAIQQILTGDEDNQNSVQNVSENQEIAPQNEKTSQNNAQFSLNNEISSVRQSANNLQRQGLTIPESTVSTFENIQNKRQGLNIEFDTNVQGNGVYNVNEDGTRTVKINPNSPRALEFTLVHELGHDLKAGDANTYQELQNYILDYAKTKEGYELARQSLGDTYAQQLGEGNFILNDEVANDILGQAIGNQQFLNSLAQSKPNVFQRIWNWFRNVLFDGNNTGKGFADRKFLNDIQNKFRTAYNQTFNNNGNNQANYSIGGQVGMQNAIDSDARFQRLENNFNRAQTMAKNGIDNEIIRQNTNWFQDKNGDWKFEFSDKDMALKQGIKLKENSTYKLGNILEHDLLFMIYPELADYNVRFEKMKGKKGSYNKESNLIRINSNFENEQSVKGTLIHEIQHAIQKIEEFESGKSSRGSKLAYYESLGEIEARDTQNRYAAEQQGGLNRKLMPPESSKSNPTHSGLNNYLNHRTTFDKIKDGIYKYLKDRGVINDSISEEANMENQNENTGLVVRGGHLEGLEKSSSFSLSKNPTNNPDIRYSQNNNQWQKFLDDNFNLMPNATRSIAEKMQNQVAEDSEALSLGKTKKVKSPVEIANMTEDDVRLPEGNYKPIKDQKTDNMRKFFENVETSDIISQKVKDNVNPTTYEQKNNIETLAKVQEKLDSEGNSLITEWFAKDIKKATDEDVALGAVLIERYQQQGDYKSAVNVVQKLADIGTEAGRAVQMFSIFQRLSPESMLIYQQKLLDSAFEDIKKKKTGEWVEQNKERFKLTEEDTKFIYDQVEKAQQATDEEAKQRELSKIENRINQKLPQEAGQAIKTLRRIAMLFNPKTQVRNVVGNSLIMPVNATADFIGTQIDKAIARKTGVRTTNYTNVADIGKGMKKGLKDAVTDYKTGTRTTESGSRFELELGAKPFNENTNSKALNTINNKLNGINDLLSAVMSGGDRPFYEAAYRNSLEGQMKANNVTTPTQDMIDIAVNEALSRTWNDNNAYTQAVLGIRRAMNKLNVKGFGLGDLLIPFAKTPANLTKAMVEYSPVGFVESIIDYNDMRKAISRGEMTAQQQKRFVTSTSKAIAGTILYAIAGTLSKSGRITGSKDKDKDVANFEQNVLGIQPYSVKIGDRTYTYSWANPINAPLAIMADTYKMSKENASKFEILTNAFRVAGDTLVENSFMQGIKDLFESDSLADGLVDAIVDLPNQFVPTFLSQFANMGDTTKRQTFEYNDRGKTAINQIKSKIPGLKNTLAPQINTFGEEVQNYGGDNNPFNIFLNPANVSETVATDTQKELYALYEVTKDKTIFPRQAPYYLSNDGEKINLSSNDRAEYQKISGQYVTENLGALFDSDFYKTLDNDKKVDVVNKIISDADTTAKDKWVDSTATEKLSKLQDELGDVPLVDYYNAYIAQKRIESDKNWQGKTITNSKSKKQKEAVDNAVSDLTKGQKERLYGIFNISEKVW